MDSPPKIRIFFSSPGDVKMERETAKRIVDRLQVELGDRVTIEPYFWEHEVMVATKDYQENIPEMDDFDIVVCMLWSRLGTPLHPNRHPRPGGGYFESGTEYEFFTAMQAHKRDGSPDIFVFRNSTEPRRPSRPREAREAVDREIDRLDQFFERYFQEENYFTAAMNLYGTLGEFEDKLSVGLRDYISHRLPVDGPRPRARAQYEGLPYLGLAAFDFADSKVFFGRTAQVGDVVEAFQTQELEAHSAAEEGKRFVLILGSSGSGKTSLARAGVMPMLIQPGVIEGAQAWRRCIFKPADAGGDPFLALSSALLRPEALPELATDGTTAAELSGLLRRQPGGAGLLLRQALNQAGAQARLEEDRRLEEKLRLLEAGNREQDAQAVREKRATLAAPVVRLALLADQMEELFTTDQPAETLSAFVELLASFAASGRIFVLGTLRSDFYPRCLEHPKLVDLMRGSGTFPLPAAGPNDIGQMIRQPAAAAGLAFEENRATGEKLDELLRDAALRDPAALPLLSYTLEQLYTRRTQEGLLTLAAYHDLGGLEGAIGSRAESVFAALPGDSQAAFDGVWRQLVTLGENGAAVRRRAHHGPLTAAPGAPGLVDGLVAARLLTADQTPDGQRIISVAHEALLRHWPRVVKWIEENRDFLRTRSRVATRMAEWVDRQRADDYLIPAGTALAEAGAILARHESALDSQEIEYIRRSVERARARELSRLRQARLVTAGAVVLSVLAVTGGVFALRESRNADRERATAVERKNAAETAAVAAEDAARAAHASQTRTAYVLGIERLESGQTREGLTSLAEALKLQPDHAGARDRLYSHHLYGLPKAIPILAADARPGLRQRISGGQVGPVERCAYLAVQHPLEVYDLVNRKVVPGPWTLEEASIAAVVFTSSQFVFSLRPDYSSVIWHIDTGKASPVIPTREGFSQIGFTDDGKWLFEGTQDGHVRLWNTETGKVEDEWQQSGSITSAMANTQCKTLVVASDELIFYDLEEKKRVSTFREPDTTFRDLRFSEDGTTAVGLQIPAGGKTGTHRFLFFKAETAERIPTRPLEAAGEVFDYDVSEDGTYVAVADLSSYAKILHREDEKRDREFKFDTYPVKICLSPDERLLISASPDGVVRIFDADKETLAYEPISHDARLEDLQITWDGRYLLTSTSRRARIWDLSTGRALTLPLKQAGRSEAGAFSADGKFLWIATSAGIQRWDSGTLEPSGELNLGGQLPYDVHMDRQARVLGSRVEPAKMAWIDLSEADASPVYWKAPRDIAFSALSADAKIAAATVEKEVYLLDPASGKPLGEPWQVDELPFGLLFTGDGKHLIAVLRSKLRMLEIATRREIPVSDPQANLGEVTTSPDGRWFATFGGGLGMATENNVLVWDLANPSRPPHHLGLNDWATCLAFSPDSSLLVTGTRDQNAQVWSPETGEPLSDPIFHPGNSVHMATFSPDGRLLATACRDETVRVWDWRVARPVSGTFTTDHDKISSLVFSPDGTRLMAVSPVSETEENTVVKVWEVSPPPGNPVDLIALTEGTTALEATPSRPPVACDPFRGWEKIRSTAPDSWFLQNPGRRTVSPAFTSPSLRWITDSGTGVDDLLLSMPSVAVVNAAISHWKQNDLSKSIEGLAKMERGTPAYENEFDRLKIIRLKVDRLAEMADRNSAGDPWTNYYLSLRSDQDDETGPAKEYIEAALAIEPDNRKFLDQANDIYFKLAEREPMVAVLRKLRKFDPENINYRARLAFALHRLGHTDEARGLIEEALRAGDLYSGDKAIMLFILGRAREALPLYREQAEANKAAASDGLYTTNDLINLITAEIRSGETDAAIEHYRLLLVQIPATADPEIISGADLLKEVKAALLEALDATLKKHPELAIKPE